MRGRRIEGAAEYPYPKWSLRWPINWLRSLAFYLLVAPFVYVMCWPRVRGKERLRDLRGPVLFIANHISMVDAGMILFALPFRFRRRLAIAMGGERLRGIASRTRRRKLVRTDVGSGEIPAGGDRLQRLRLAAEERIPPRLRFRRRGGGSGATMRSSFPKAARPKTGE